MRTTSGRTRRAVVRAGRARRGPPAPRRRPGGRPSAGCGIPGVEHRCRRRRSWRGRQPQALRSVVVASSARGHARRVTGRLRYPCEPTCSILSSGRRRPDRARWSTSSRSAATSARSPTRSRRRCAPYPHLEVVRDGDAVVARTQPGPGRARGRGRPHRHRADRRTTSRAWLGDGDLRAQGPRHRRHERGGVGGRPALAARARSRRAPSRARRDVDVLRPRGGRGRR